MKIRDSQNIKVYINTKHILKVLTLQFHIVIVELREISTYNDKQSI